MKSILSIISLAIGICDLIKYAKYTKDGIADKAFDCKLRACFFILTSMMINLFLHL